LQLVQNPQVSIQFHPKGGHNVVAEISGKVVLYKV